MVTSLTDHPGLELRVIFVLPLQMLATSSLPLKSKEMLWDHMKGATFHKYRRHWYFSHSCVFLFMGINRARDKQVRIALPCELAKRKGVMEIFLDLLFKSPPPAITWAIQVILQESTTEHVFSKSVS